MLPPRLQERLTAAAAEAFCGVPVLAAYAYGSRVSGRPLPASDLDVGYYLEGYRDEAVLSLAEEMRLADRLSELVGVEVDLRNLGVAPLELRGRVLEDGVRVYSGPAAARVALEREVLARYHDYKPTFERMHATRLAARARRSAAR